MKVTKIDHWKNWKTEDNVTISNPEDKNKKYLCNYCDRILTVWLDKDTLYCNDCQVSVVPSSQDIRSTQDLTVPEGPAEETLVSSIHSGYDKVKIRKEPELRGSFKALRDKGLKFTSYTTTESS